LGSATFRLSLERLFHAHIDCLGPGNRRESEASSGKYGVASAKLRDTSLLICKGLSVGGFRIDEAPQRGLAILDDAEVIRILAEVAGFLRIVIEVE
jgi:hypothetical protein